jgi:hypothetical protein
MTIIDVGADIVVPTTTLKTFAALTSKSNARSFNV